MMSPTTTTLVLLRHGLSTWNQENRFTGWTDIDLNDRGKAEAKEAARLLMAREFSVDIAFTEHTSDAEMAELNIPAGIPLIYTLDEHLHVKNHYYVGDSEHIAAARQTVVNQEQYCY